VTPEQKEKAAKLIDAELAKANPAAERQAAHMESDATEGFRDVHNLAKRVKIARAVAQDTLREETQKRDALYPDDEGPKHITPEMLISAFHIGETDGKA